MTPTKPPGFPSIAARFQEHVEAAGLQDVPEMIRGVWWSGFACCLEAMSEDLAKLPEAAAMAAITGMHLEVMQFKLEQEKRAAHLQAIHRTATGAKPN